MPSTKRPRASSKAEMTEEDTRAHETLVQDFDRQRKC